MRSIASLYSGVDVRVPILQFQKPNQCVVQQSISHITQPMYNLQKLLSVKVGELIINISPAHNN